jgi:hypothetical protein
LNTENYLREKTSSGESSCISEVHELLNRRVTASLASNDRLDTFISR